MKNTLKLVLSLWMIVLSQTQKAALKSWSYEDVAAWGGLCNSGQKQSPIDLTEADPSIEDVDPFKFDGHDLCKTCDKLKDNGFTIQVDWTGSQWANISGGHLDPKKRYYVRQFHLHWGDNVAVGSEHTLAGNAFPMELHIVHNDVTQSSFGKAATKVPEGLAVLGFFFEITDTNNENFEPFSQAMQKLMELGEMQSTPIKYNLWKLIEPATEGPFYRYSGSLTTPGCFETVAWTVFEIPIKISEQQMEPFWFYRYNNNFRPVQPLNGRNLLKYS